MSASIISHRKYRKLVRRGIKLLKNRDRLGYDAERIIRGMALEFLPADMPDRKEHADDLALQAISDAAAATGRTDELDSPDW